MAKNLLPPILLLALTSACTEVPPPPVFGDPVPLVSPAGTGVEGPRLSAGAGRLILSWMERNRPGGTLYYSELTPTGWNEATAVVSDPAMFVNWADLPSVIALDDNRWFAHWLSFSAEGAYSYDVRVMMGSGKEPNWGPSFSPHDDGTPTEHGFVSALPLGDRTGLIWLDGRNTLAPAATEAGAHAGHGGGMTLRAASIGPASELRQEQQIDDLVCDCCQTDIAMASGGPLAVYRNRTRDEVRDIYLSRYVDGVWRPGERFSFDNWNISGCPVNGPTIAAHDDLAVVTWFTAANGRPLLNARVSNDGGKSFGDRLIVAQYSVVGHADSVALSDNAVAVSWVESSRKELDNIRVRSLASDGALSPVQTVGRTALGRIVPQLARAGDELILAWSDELSGERRISSIRVPIEPGRAE